MRNPIPKPASPNATAKFTLEFSDGLAVAGYLFTNGLAPAKDEVIPGYAWIGGELRLPGTASVRRARGRAHRLSAACDIRTDADRSALFTSGRVVVAANEGHGTRQAEADFDTPGNLLAALEDALALAGWTLITGGQGTAAERQILADAGLRPEPELACTGYEPEAEPVLSEAEQAMWEHLVDVARRLDPAADAAVLVAGLPGYQQVRDAIDPEQRTYKGPRCHRMGDALRAISAFDRYHNRPTVTALVKRARTNHPAPGWWDSPGDDERSWQELLEGWQEAVREAVAYWHANGETTDCEPAFAWLPRTWRATADVLMAEPDTLNGAIAGILRKCADELDAALPTTP